MHAMTAKPYVSVIHKNRNPLSSRGEGSVRGRNPTTAGIEPFEELLENILYVDFFFIMPQYIVDIPISLLYRK